MFDSPEGAWRWEVRPEGACGRRRDLHAMHPSRSSLGAQLPSLQPMHQTVFGETKLEVFEKFGRRPAMDWGCLARKRTIAMLRDQFSCYLESRRPFGSRRVRISSTKESSKVVQMN